jgi:hypothetical protein
VVIPSTIDSLPVTAIGFRAFAVCTTLTNVTIPDSMKTIGYGAFAQCSNLTSVTIPNSVTSIEESAFGLCTHLTSVTIPNSVTSIEKTVYWLCTGLTSVTIPNSVTNIGQAAFKDCTNLTSITIPNSVIKIASWAFFNCASLTSVTIGNGVTNIEMVAFSDCPSLTKVLFEGNAPVLDPSFHPFDRSLRTIYYKAGTTGWGPYSDGIPTRLWNPRPLTGDVSFGVHSNEFGFTITGSSNLVVVVEANSNLNNSVWNPIQTNILTDGSFHFRDPQWTNYSGRFYRLNMP